MRGVFRSGSSISWRAAIVAAISGAVFLVLMLPRVPAGSVIGTGQDEWYNVVRSLKALYENLHPSYFIHPALYYEVLAAVYGAMRAGLDRTGALGANGDFLGYFLSHEPQFIDVARHTSVVFGTLAVVAAAWLGTLLGGAAAGLLAGVLVATLPLLQTLSTSIRVDALALATAVGATALVVRWHRLQDRRSLTAACVGVGIAAAANYPGALLLGLLGWLAWGQRGVQPPALVARRVVQACAVAFATFLVLNPYVLLDFRMFFRWFTFTAAVPLYIHPHAPEPNPWHYADLLRDQGVAVLIACMTATLAALIKPRQPTGAIALYGLLQLLAFSAMQSQYDRFVLPAITFLCIAGAAAACSFVSTYIGPRIGAGLAVGAAALVVWSSTERFKLEAPVDQEPDYRAAMFAWIEEHVPPTATLLLESDTMPLLQTIYDPGFQPGAFQSSLRQAFEERHPGLVRNIVKAQFIAAIYNYDPKLLESGDVYFLASSQNREFIDANRPLLTEPATFYEALDKRASVVHEAGGFHERLVLYRSKQS